MVLHKLTDNEVSYESGVFELYYRSHYLIGLGLTETQKDHSLMKAENALPIPGRMYYHNETENAFQIWLYRAYLDKLTKKED